MKPLTIQIRGERDIPRPELPGVQMDVVCNPDGTLTVTADPETMARLAGRTAFGRTRPARDLLRERIADSWYDAGCPSFSAQTEQQPNANASASGWKVRES